MEDRRASYHEIHMGKPAHGLVWGMDGGIGNGRPPTDASFETRDGRQYLRSASLAMMRRRQKNQKPLFYVTQYNNVEYIESEDGDYDVFTWKTPLGCLTGRRRMNHFEEYPVKTVDDIAAWTCVHRNMAFTPNPAWLKNNDPASMKSFGINWSPVQHLLQFDTGIENFHFFLQDAPEAMAELIAVMQDRCMERLRLGLSMFPNAGWIYWGENTSSSSISPSQYRQFSMRHVREYADMIHASGKRLIVHMCGLLKALLDCFPETGMDGIDSATPPPIGDAPYDVIHAKFKRPDLTIVGRLNAQLWVGKTKEQIQATLRETMFPGLVETPFCLMVTSDALPDIPARDAHTVYEALESMTW
ncbi:MAG TPA: uroporphyrinogen decarboxylase family protein [Candidatus Brocadiia bacterium]|nr:uroporphyrinogen decarboxylase family protein [Candidatus Brocadiia bacterium]